jgi:hypothetical protein
MLALIGQSRFLNGYLTNTLTNTTVMFMLALIGQSRILNGYLTNTLTNTLTNMTVAAISIMMMVILNTLVHVGLARRRCRILVVVVSSSLLYPRCILCCRHISPLVVNC